MPKVKISEYSATANSNTDVASINIDEGCAPSGINNAIRAVMGHLKDFQQGTNGDPFNGPHNGTVGATTPAAGAFTSLTASTTLGVTGVSTLTGGAVIEGLTVGKGAGAVSTNTAVGASALAGANTGAGRNTAVGRNALIVNTSATDNSAFGDSALSSNTTGLYNDAHGRTSLLSNTTGQSNAGFGYSSLLSNSTGSYNTAIGNSSLYSNTTASNNTAVGYQAGYTNSTGTANTFTGYQAGYTSNATATNGYNTATGYQAGKGLTTGVQNSFFGFGSGQLITSGGKNTIVGAYDGNTGGLDIRTASNYIVLSDGDGNPILISSQNGSIAANHTSTAGNPQFEFRRGGTTRYVIWNDNSTNNLNIVPASFTSGVTLTPSATSWSAYSDRRIKSNIVDLDYGLDTIMAIQPRRYTVIANGENSIGFIAQELKEVLPEAVVGEEIPFDDADTPQERSSKTMGIAKDHIIPVLVKAIQELKAEVDSLKAQINGASA